MFCYLLVRIRKGSLGSASGLQNPHPRGAAADHLPLEAGPELLYYMIISWNDLANMYKCIHQSICINMCYYMILCDRLYNIIWFLPVQDADEGLAAGRGDLDVHLGRHCGQSPYEHSGFRRAWLKHNLNLKGWNSQVHRGFPRKFESSNVSRGNVSREIGRTCLTLLI